MSDKAEVIIDDLSHGWRYVGFQIAGRTYWVGTAWDADRIAELTATATEIVRRWNAGEPPTETAALDAKDAAGG